MNNGNGQLNATGYAFENEIRTCFKTENIKFMQITVSWGKA